VEGLLEQWVRFTCVLLGDESVCAAKRLYEVLFKWGQERRVCYGFQEGHSLINGSIFVLVLEDMEGVC
jgi:hypothetical protein